MLYNAFISYSHTEGELASALQSALHRFTRRWYQVRAIRVFRDKSNLAISPGLWSSIEKSLKQSEFFVLLASPAAAESKWVQQEVDYWLKNRDTNKFLIVLANGEFAWDLGRCDMDWGNTSALPRALVGQFKEEPLYVDLRWAKITDDFSLKNPKFLDSVADIASTLHNRAKDELIGEDVRQYRRTKRLAWSAVILLFLLTLAASGAAVIAAFQRGQAVSRELAATAVSQVTNDAELGILLALRALSVSVTSEAEDALHRSVQASRIRLTLRSPTAKVTSVAFNPDDSRVATADANGIVRIWDASSGAEVNQLTAHKDQAIFRVTFSRDGDLLATASGDHTVKIWRVATGNVLQSFVSTGKLAAVAFSPNGSYVAAAGEDATASIWHIVSGQEVHKFIGHSKTIFDLAFSPDGMLLATASGDGTVKIWEIARGREIARLQHGEQKVLGIAFSSNGQILASGGEDRTVKIWDMVTHKLLFPLVGHSRAVKAVAFSPVGSFLATAGEDRVVYVWDVNSREKILSLGGHTDPVVDVAFDHTGTNLATASYDHTAKVWDLEESHEVITLSGHDRGIYGVAFNSHGTQLATASADRTARVWDVQSGRQLLLFRGHSGTVTSVAFSPDGNSLATASWDHQARVWDIKSPTNYVSLVGHSAPVVAVVFSTDGLRVITASLDGTTKVWDSRSGQEVLTLTGHNNMISSISISPDGKYLASSSYDRTVRVYALNITNLIELAHRRVTRGFRQEECQKYLHIRECSPPSWLSWRWFTLGHTPSVVKE